MVDSTQVFSALVVLFLIFSVPFPGKIRFSSEVSPFQRSTALRGGGAVAPISNGGFRRRTRVENSGFPTFSSEKPSTRSALSENETHGFSEQYQEEVGEEPVDAPSRASSRKLEEGVSHTQSLEIPSPAFYSAPEKLNVKNMRLLERIIPKTPATAMPQTPLQGSSGMTSTANQTSRIPPVVVTPSPSLDSTVASVFGHEQSPSVNAEEQLVSNLYEEDGDKSFVSAAGIIFRSTSLLHMAGAHLLVVSPETTEDSQCASPVSLPSNFSAGGYAFFPQKNLAETEACSSPSYRSSPPLAGKRRRSLSLPSSSSETESFFYLNPSWE